MSDELVPTSQITAKIERAAEIKSELDRLRPLRDEYDQLREEIKYDMIAAKSKRSEPIAGFFAVREERKTWIVTDDAALEDWLEENVMDPDQYKKFDSALIKQLQDRVMQETGEYIPGIEAALTETVSLRRAKQ